MFLNFSNICNMRFPVSSIRMGFSWFSSFSLNFWFSFGNDEHSWFPIIFSLTDWFWINNSKILSKVYLVMSSTEYLNNLKTLSFLRFLFPRLSVWIEAIINISGSLFPTVEGVLKFDLAGLLKFNNASESWLDDVILVR